MAAAPILATRQAIVIWLKADVTVTAVLPAARIFGERSDSALGWPFSRIGELEGAPGHEITGALHVFSKDEFTDEVATILERIGSSLDGAVLTLADGRRANVDLARSRIIPDAAEQSAWHGILSISVTIIKDCDER